MTFTTNRPRPSAELSKKHITINQEPTQNYQESRPIQLTSFPSESTTRDTSSPSTPRDASPARDPSFRRIDRARRSQLSLNSDTWSPNDQHSTNLFGRLKRWRHNEGKVWVELGCSCLTILLVGMADSATGSNLPSMQETYAVSYTVISLVFLANTLGYFLSSLSNSFLLHHFGLRNSLLLAGFFYSSGSLVLSQRPPFAVAALGLALMGGGSGLYDALLTTVVSHWEEGPLMSLMYSFFGIGATISPFLIGYFVDKGIDWNKFYYIPLGISLLFGFLHIVLFSNYDQPIESHDDQHLTTRSIGSSQQQQQQQQQQQSSSTLAPPPPSPTPISARASLEASLPPAVRHRPPPHTYASQSPRERFASSTKYPLVWLGAGLVILGFASTDVFGSWLPSYLLDVKGASPTASRYSLAGLWGGIALGRILLAYPSSRLGEKMASIGLLGFVIGGLSLLWKIGNVKAGQGVVVLTGFCLGPITPNIISLTTSRVPASLKSTVVGILIGLGLIGSAIGPLFVGLAAQRTGLVILPGVLIVISTISVAGLVAVRSSSKRED